MRRILLLVPLLLLIARTPCMAGGGGDDFRLGLSCRKILAMKPENWAEYYNKKQPGGEVGYDQAYDAYADCMKERNDQALAKLPRQAAARLRRYRDLCGKFRVAELELHQAYAGGGTMYTHATVRGRIDDEQLVLRLAKLYARPQSTPGSAASTTVLRTVGDGAHRFGLLETERTDARLLIVKFLDEESRGFGG